ncbi:hypothetical protein V8J88_24330 [Massilia sp. W12]
MCRKLAIYYFWLSFPLSLALAVMGILPGRMIGIFIVLSLIPYAWCCRKD